MKTYPTYKDSGVDWLGKIPKDWKTKRSKFLWTEITNLSEEGNEQLLSVSQYDGVKTNENESRSENLIGYKKVSKDNLVTNIMLAWLGGLGISNFNGVVSPAYSIYKASNEISPRFTHYLYRTKIYLDEFARRSSGVVPSRWRMYTDDFGEVRTILPPKPEQQAIANFLDETCRKLDTIVAQKEKMIALLKERKQAFIQKAVTRGLNENVPQKDSGVDWIGDIPENWEVKRLGMFGYFSKGGGFSKSDLTEQGVKAILYGDIYTKYNFEVKSAVRTIGIKTAKKARLLKKNELLFTGSGETKEDIGKCVTFQSDEITVAGGDVIIFTPVSNNSKYLSYVMNSELVKAEKAKTAKGEIIIHTYASKLKDIHLPIPPKGEQEKIVNYIDAQSQKIDQAVTQQEQAIVKLKEYKASLIDSCVLGKIKVS
tara:strand:- start:10086 stop:11363 length:1278 start_codon:yes stop_codon:yes gene_type:complete